MLVVDNSIQSRPNGLDLLYLYSDQWEGGLDLTQHFWEPVAEYGECFMTLFYLFACCRVQKMILWKFGAFNQKPSRTCRLEQS